MDERLSATTVRGKSMRANPRMRILRRGLTVVLVGLALALIGCGGAPKAGDRIASIELTEDQREIVDLITQDGEREILLFEYRIGGGYRALEAWVEVYEHGKPVDAHPVDVSISSGSDASGKERPLSGEGKLCFVIRAKPTHGWAFTISQDGGRVSGQGDAGRMYDTSSRASGIINEPADIEPGREIVLYSAIFTDGNMIRAYDGQEFADRPELMRDYEYVHLIKVRFD